jgi:hypothetical protein
MLVFPHPARSAAGAALERNKRGSIREGAESGTHRTAGDLTAHALSTPQRRRSADHIMAKQNILLG